MFFCCPASVNENVNLTVPCSFLKTTLCITALTEYFFMKQICVYNYLNTNIAILSVPFGCCKMFFCSVLSGTA